MFTDEIMFSSYTDDTFSHISENEYCKLSFPGYICRDWHNTTETVVLLVMQQILTEKKNAWNKKRQYLLVCCINLAPTCLTLDLMQMNCCRCSKILYNV